MSQALSRKVKIFRERRIVRLGKMTQDKIRSHHDRHTALSRCCMHSSCINSSRCTTTCYIHNLLEAVTLRCYSMETGCLVSNASPITAFPSDPEMAFQTWATPTTDQQREHGKDKQYRERTGGLGLFLTMFSIFSRISGVNFGITSIALRLSRTCAGLVAPRMTVLVFGFRATQANASCPTVHPRSARVSH